jgi:amino acid permease
LGTGIDALVDWDPVWALQLYLPLPLFFGLFIVYKLRMKTRLVTLDECDLTTEYRRYKKGDQA